MFEVKQTIIDWLLEDSNPPVKYLTSRNILEQTDTIQLEKLRKSINSYRPIHEILRNQKENRYWSFKFGKYGNYELYRGTYWQLQFLNNMHATRTEQIENAIDHIFETGQAPNGGFIHATLKSRFFLCLTASMLDAVIHFGYLDDERTHRAMEFLLVNFVDTGGATQCFTRGLISNCYMALPQILRAFSAVLKKKRTPRIRKGISLCSERLLENHIYQYVPEKKSEFVRATSKLRGQEHLDEKNRFLQKNPDMKLIEKKGWMKFKFPHSYNSDALDAMHALVSAEVKYDPRMNEALALIKTQEQKGKWINWQNLRSPMYTTIEESKQPSKWLTLRALEVLKYYEGITVT